MNRPRILAFFLTTLLATLARADDPAPGDTRAEAENQLGKPVAVKKATNGELVAKYPRGTVTYYNNRVVKVAMLTPEEYRKRKAEEQAEELASAARAKIAAEAKAARAAEENRRRDTLLTSEAYRQLSTSGRIAALAKFAESHPEAELSVLRNDLELMLRREETARRDQASDAAARKALEEKIKILEERVNQLSAKIDALGAPPAPTPTGIRKDSPASAPAPAPLLPVPPGAKK